MNWDKSNYGTLRRSLYASINGTKGNLTKLSKIRLLKGREKELLLKVMEVITELSLEIKENNDPKNFVKKT